MYRTLWHRTLVLTTLMMGLVISIAGVSLAASTITQVTGRADLLDMVSGGEIRSDSDGNLHFFEVLQQGYFFLQGGDITIDGIQMLVLNGKLDSSFTGPFSGTFTVITDVEGQDTVIWEGHVHGRVVELIFAGSIAAQGRGPFEGMLLQLEVQEDPPTMENPNPETFDLTGRILAPQVQ